MNVNFNTRANFTTGRNKTRLWFWYKAEYVSQRHFVVTCVLQLYLVICDRNPDDLHRGHRRGVVTASSCGRLAPSRARARN